MVSQQGMRLGTAEDREKLPVLAGGLLPGWPTRERATAAQQRKNDEEQRDDGRR